MAISRDRWQAPDYYRSEDWENSEQLSGRVSPYDLASYEDFERVHLSARRLVKGIAYGLVSIAAIVCGAYLIGRIAVWIALVLT